MTTTRSLRMPRRGEAPTLGGATGWINSRPLGPDELRGRVVAYVFWTYTCINWLRTLPYVRAWDTKYRDDGLIVVGIHAPEFPFEHDIDYVRRAVQDHDIDFPVPLDNDYAIWRSFGNRFWPALYLADDRGVVRYTHFGEGSESRSERAIQELLFDDGLDRGVVDPDAQGDEAPAVWNDLESPETYLGYGRTENFASAPGLIPDRPSQYTPPSHLSLNSWALSGCWTARRDHVLLRPGGGSLAIRFHARDLHLVLGREEDGPPLRFRVTLDGRPPGDAHGLDIDETGDGQVAEPRMYQLLRQPQPITDRTAAIEFLDPDAQAFVVTFG
jgi:thiol-disulfide isomerase/thioredoxin